LFRLLTDFVADQIDDDSHGRETLLETCQSQLRDKTRLQIVRCPGIGQKSGYRIRQVDQT
jgi:hypothetical protein